MYFFNPERIYYKEKAEEEKIILKNIQIKQNKLKNHK